MTEQEILEGNRLIAEFMGAVIKDMGDGIMGFHFPSPVPTEKNLSGWLNKTATKYLYYHCSWDWIMPVLDKISEFKDPNHKDYWNGFEVIDIRIFRESMPVTFNEIIRFIKWHNLNLKNN